MKTTLLMATLVILGGTLTRSIAEDKKPGKFSTSDLAAWGRKTGDWKVVGGVKPGEKNPKLLSSSAGTGILLNGDKGRTSNLVSSGQHGDVQAHIEFMVPRGSNSGVYFQGRYEVQILDSWGRKNVKYGDCGGIYASIGKKGSGHPPSFNASLPPGKWQIFDVTFRAPRFDKDGRKTANAIFVKVVHNGKVVQKNIEVPGPTISPAFRDEKPTGPLMLQGDHGPVAYRNIRLEALKK